MNEVVVDVKIQPDVKIFSESINFTGSIKSGEFTMENNIKRARYTYIKIVFLGEVMEDMAEIIKPFNYVRVVGKLDSDVYQAKSGKTVYNKILVANKLTPIKYDYESDDYIVLVE